MRARPLSFWRRSRRGLVFFIAGALATLGTEAVGGLVLGVPVTVPASASMALISTVKTSARQQWPMLTRNIENGARPVILQDVHYVVAHTEVQIMGVSFVLPALWQKPLDDALTALALKSVDRYIHSRITVNRVLSPSLIETMLSHSTAKRLRVRVFGLPVLVRMTIEFR